MRQNMIFTQGFLNSRQRTELRDNGNIVRNIEWGPNTRKNMAKESGFKFGFVITKLRK